MNDEPIVQPEEKQKFRRAEHIRAEMIVDVDDEDVDVAELEAMNDDEAEGIDPDGNGAGDDALIRVGKDSNPNKLAYHIVKCIQKYHVAETQSIGPVAHKNALHAIIRAESIISQYTTCERLAIVPCFRKPRMRNGEERTAIRLRVMPVHIKHLH